MVRRKKYVLDRTSFANYLPFQIIVVFLAEIWSLIFGNGSRLDKKKKSWLKDRFYFKIEVLKRGVYLAKTNQS